MRKLLLSLCCLLWTMLPASAQSAASAVTASEQREPDSLPRGRLTGHVICSDTRLPARGALVSVTALENLDGHPQARGIGGERFAHVRDDGSYAVEHLAPGTYTATATKAGYITSLDDLLDVDPKLGVSVNMKHARESQPSATVTANGTGILNLALERGATLSGQVIYSDGAPATSILVVPEEATKRPPSQSDADLRMAMNTSFSRRLYGIGTVSTDDRGRFRLAGLRAGKYRLAAVEPVPGGITTDPMELNQQMSYTLFNIPDPRGLRVYAGDTVHEANAKTFTVRPGDEESGIVITLPLNALHEVRGQVLAVDGRAINMGNLLLTSTSDPQLAFQTRLAMDGAFVFDDIPAGTYKLTVTAARIGERASGPPGVPAAFLPLLPVTAFADGSLSVLVQDDDIEALRLALPPIPLPDATADSTANKP